MKVISQLSGDTLDGITYNFLLDSYSEETDEAVLFNGGACIPDVQFFPSQLEYKKYKRKIFLDLASPCFFLQPRDGFGHDFHEQMDYFDEVFSICPYTVDWMNKQNNYNKFKNIDYPFEHNKTFQNPTKTHEVCYFGGAHGQFHKECIDIISKFNYRFLSQLSHPKVTDLFVPHAKKLDIISQCKIAIVYNLLPLCERDVRLVREYKNWESHGAFTELLQVQNPVGWYGTCPQFKCRCHEAIWCKTLVLCMKDNWNLIENYYIPGEHFIYFKDNSELEQKIREILNNWGDFYPIVENAWNYFASRYTTQHIYHYIKDYHEI